MMSLTNCRDPLCKRNWSVPKDWCGPELPGKRYWMSGGRHQSECPADIIGTRRPDWTFERSGGRAHHGTGPVRTPPLRNRLRQDGRQFVGHFELHESSAGQGVRVALVYGFSMGAQQAFHWGALFPDRVERDRADLRFGQDLGSQFRFSRRRQGGADRPSGLAGRRVRHPADARLPGDGPRLCRLGAEPGVLSRGESGARSASPRWRTS